MPKDKDKILSSFFFKRRGSWQYLTYNALPYLSTSIDTHITNRKACITPIEHFVVLFVVEIAAGFAGWVAGTWLGSGLSGLPTAAVAHLQSFEYGSFEAVG